MESSDAGASSASKIGTLRLASDIEINDFIDLSGKPCRVNDFDFPSSLSLSLVNHHMILNFELDFGCVASIFKSDLFPFSPVTISVLFKIQIY